MLIPAVKEYRSTKSPWQIFQSVYRHSDRCFFLDSIQADGPDQNYSYIGADPFAEMRVFQDKKGQYRLDVTGKLPRFIETGEELLVSLRRFLPIVPAKGHSRYPFFKGGAVGFFGYDLASFFEPVRPRKKPRPDMPLLYLGLFSEILTYDHRRKLYFLSTYRRDRTKKQAAGYPPLKAFLEPQAADRRREEEFKLLGFRPGISRARFKTMVKRAKSYIAAGDIYQANLSQRFSFRCKGSRLRLYENLRNINPSPFASFLKVDGLEIISSSPERLVMKRGRYCETRPIAGTRPRRQIRKKLSELKRELCGSEKERAEHVMLVDLERNDLGRVCEWNSVRVEELMKVEMYSHVMHLVSKITGRLQKGRDGFDLIRAMFPGGTITGCPKVRCMEIIDELEPVGRGIYTGSIGYLDFSGDLDLNIVIRTLVIRNGEGHLQVGAGIVYDSDPDKEYEETLHKGEALVEALICASGGLKRKKTKKKKP